MLYARRVLPRALAQVDAIATPSRATARDVIVTGVATIPLAALSTIVSAIAPAFGQGGVLRVVATKSSRACEALLSAQSCWVIFSRT